MSIPPRILTIALLIASNVFMTFAWYGHLKYKQVPILIVILVSWLIALPEYFLAVPANRIGSAVYSTAQLKGIQEVISLSVFALFSILYLGERITANHLIGFSLIAAGAFFLFRGAGN
ncbi:DMT family protein [Sphingomonas sp. BGYR3]|uniref:DMT family protein n=1 Tax=Sphingomonas sp. BGYR3 TaxID=2975483 RepID=UPI0021A5FFC2|nr:DMT family protein [Sphingomonas sp. BGYR3]MDG5487123.1 DMT family protein [Sphingomonas sp. BGYR3]